MKLVHGGAFAVLAALGATAAFASEAPDGALCRDCGVVQDIRRLALPVRPPVQPPGPSGPLQGSGQGTTPLFSIGPGGIQRADPYATSPQQKVVWEVTVRYDNGAYGVTRVDHEPDLKVGERVRLIETGSENQLQRLPPAKP